MTAASLQLGALLLRAILLAAAHSRAAGDGRPNLALFFVVSTSSQTLSPPSDALPLMSLGSGGSVCAPAKDDMGYGDPSCFGGSEVVTPSIDRMAAEGLKFTTWYSAAPVCTPSRAGLLLGRLPKRTGFCGPGVMWCNSLSGIPANETTFAAALQRAGYRTQMVGKASAAAPPPPFSAWRHGGLAGEAEGAD